MNDYSFLYSESIFAFLKRAENLGSQIAHEQLGLDIEGKKKPYFFKNGRYWPLHFVVFQEKEKLGFFNSQSLEIGIHKQYLFTSDNALRELLEHELAHYMLFIESGDLSHSKAFKDFCKKHGFSASVAMAKSKEDPLNELPDLVRKVEKLLSLAKSSNVFEAQSATQKANELVLKHNLNKDHIHFDKETFFLRRVIEQKRADSLMHCIQTILSRLPLQVVVNSCFEKVFLEVLGTEENVKVAEYIAHFLKRELPKLWEEEKKRGQLKGLCGKNNFFQGFSRSFLNEDEKLASSKSLQLLQKQLQLFSKGIYPGLRQESVKRKFCPKAQASGMAAAKKLKIPQGIEGFQKSLALS